MKYSEIIKDLECCSSQNCCEYCGLKSDKKNCVSTLCLNAHALITRQQSEIERLTKSLELVKGAKCVYSYDGEQRDKSSVYHCEGCKYSECTDCVAERVADYLIANGVICPPCKVGPKVWLLRKDRVPDDDYRMNFHDEWVICKVDFQLSMINLIGKTIFLTPEEAEKALERSKGNE